MPDLEVRRLSGRILDGAGVTLGEARLWAAGERGDNPSWWGWVRATDLPAPLPPGRYTFAALDGWQATFDTGHAPSTRVFETELIAFRGEGEVPWPASDVSPSTPPSDAATPSE